MMKTQIVNEELRDIVFAVSALTLDFNTSFKLNFPVEKKILKEQGGET